MGAAPHQGPQWPDHPREQRGEWALSSQLLVTQVAFKLPEGFPPL